MAVLTREQVLNAQDRKPELISVPEWGGELWVRGLSAKDRGLYELWTVQASASSAGITQGNITLDHVALIRVRLISLCVIVDETDTKPLFTEADVAALSEKDSAPVERLFDVAARLSGLSKEDAQKLTELPNSPGVSGSSE
jgi:hypothetical protein